MCRIKTECISIDFYLVKCQYNNNFICFWSNCRYNNNDIKQNFNRHFSVHLNETQLICDKCNKEFAEKSSLNRHKKTNSFTIQHHKRFHNNRDKGFDRNQTTH